VVKADLDALARGAHAVGEVEWRVRLPATMNEARPLAGQPRDEVHRLLLGHPKRRQDELPAE
jgi:hypothetical protein